MMTQLFLLTVGFASKLEGSDHGPKPYERRVSKRDREQARQASASTSGAQYVRETATWNRTIDFVVSRTRNNSA